ncbi:MAG: N-acetylglucosamine-6-phosphate deacetylase [Phycisphaeraceae bacterium]|nr:N-acetylglucosamine-6-phosphate deacetylase [Phycisphaeraceae bacterium]
MSAPPAIAYTGTAFVDGALREGVAVVIRDGLIDAVTRADDRHALRDVEFRDAGERVIAPGFVDIHIHGSGGCRAEEDPQGMARHVVRHGTTYFLPTMISNELPAMLEAIDVVRARMGRVDRGARIGGIHLEGPFLNPRYGAQRPETNIEPDPESVRALVDRCGPDLRLVTIAPERRGAIDAIRAFRAAGATVSVGHSDADEDEFRAGRAAGITHATHLFNAMPPRQWPTYETFDGTKGAGLEELILADDGMTADIICDRHGRHVNDTMLAIALKCKGSTGLSLITDAVPPAGLRPGSYPLGDGQTIVTVPDDDVSRLPCGALCGSALSMSGALSNFMRHLNVGLETALSMVTEAPARAIGVFDRRGSLSPGKDADIVLLTGEGEVTMTTVGGELMFGG